MDQEGTSLQHTLENNHFPMICQTTLIENLKKTKPQMLDKVMFMGFFPPWKASLISIKFYVPFFSLNTE